MKISTDNRFHTLGLNTLTFTGVSLLWGQMLGLISVWFTPLTIITLLIAYGSEVNNKDAINKTTSPSIN
jgi:hypothetical protein